MVGFLFDLPLVISGLLVVGIMCGYSICGLLLVRRYVLPRLRIGHEDAHFSAAMVHSVMVFYGLALALIAVHVFETYDDVSKITSQEATSAAVLYHDVSAYPEPIRSQLRNQLVEYLDFVIHNDWPLQQKGEVPDEGITRMAATGDVLYRFEPATRGQELMHGETLHAYNNLIQAHRLRLDAVRTRLPGLMWIVILSGALISLTAASFFEVDDVWLHGILVVLLATFVGLVIFVTFALDWPFRGDLAVTPEPYQLVYDQLTKQ